MIDLITGFLLLLAQVEGEKEERFDTAPPAPIEHCYMSKIPTEWVCKTVDGRKILWA